jgi:hypothetical protein
VRYVEAGGCRTTGEQKEDFWQQPLVFRVMFPWVVAALWRMMLAAEALTLCCCPRLVPP